MKKDDIKRLVGRREEDRVYDAVAKLPGIRASYRNLYISPSRGGSAEIDLVLLSDRGIFVVESKSYSGTIVGSRTRYEWTHRYKPPGAKSKERVTKFYNPLRQVSAQMDKLSRCLGIPVKHISGLVVFSARATLKKVPARADNCDCVVLQSRFAASYIKRCIARRQPRFSPTELRRLQQRIDAIPKANDAIKRRHIAQVLEAERKRKAEQKHRRTSRKR